MLPRRSPGQRQAGSWSRAVAFMPPALALSGAVETTALVRGDGRAAASRVGREDSGSWRGKASVLRGLASPFLSKTFGGSTGRVDVRVVGLPLDQASAPNRDARIPESDLGAAASNTAYCDNHSEGHPEAKIEDLLGLGAEFLVRRNYVFEYATRRRSAFERADLCPSKDDIGRVEGLDSGEVTPVRGLDKTQHELDRVGCRELVGHRPAKYPAWRAGAASRGRRGRGRTAVYVVHARAAARHPPPTAGLASLQSEIRVSRAYFEAGDHGGRCSG